MIDTPDGEVRNRAAAPAVTVTTQSGPTPLDDVLAGLGEGGGDVTSGSITDATAVGRAVLTAASAATARTAVGAGTSSLALGTTAATAAAGNHSHTGLLAGAAPVVANSAAADVPALLADYNALLAALRSRGVIGA